MTRSIAILPERSLLHAGGPDAREFLHNLLTSEIRGLEAGEASYGALLTPQGKILFDVFVAAVEDGFLIDCGTAAIDDFLRRLTMYRLRSKVVLTKRPDLSVAAIWGDGAPDTLGIHFSDPRYAGMGHRAIAQGMAGTAPSDVYHAHRIALGIADWGADMGSGELFPHEANLDQLGGVSFSKGCFVGQEVVSRMQHRGTGGRNRILPVRFEGPAPAKGSDVVAGDRKLGTVLSAAGARALAILRLDKADAAYAAGEDLRAEGKALTIEQPPWANFAVPKRGAAA